MVASAAGTRHRTPASAGQNFSFTGPPKVTLKIPLLGSLFLCSLLQRVHSEKEPTPDRSARDCPENREQRNRERGTRTTPDADRIARARVARSARDCPENREQRNRERGTRTTPDADRIARATRRSVVA